MSTSVRCWAENAYMRRVPGKSDILVRAQPGVSGRLRRCLPIGELRSGAYRVRKDLLPDEAFAAYDVYLNPHSDVQLATWRELAAAQPSFATALVRPWGGL